MRCDRPLYRMPPVAMFSTFIAAVPLGIARHAIEEFVKLADAKTPALSGSVLADKPVAQDRLGRAHAIVAAGRRYLIETLGDLWERCKEVTRPPCPTAPPSGWPPPMRGKRPGAIELSPPRPGRAVSTRSVPAGSLLRDARTAVQHICTQE